MNDLSRSALRLKKHDESSTQNPSAPYDEHHEVSLSNQTIVIQSSIDPDFFLVVKPEELKRASFQFP
jgi:hypothetical protein